jgi:ubiquinone/menaquinone biosynthesis C-methylase UbiE
MDTQLDAFRRRMYRFYWAVQGVIAPGLKNSQFAYRDKLMSLVSPKTKWLDLGCGHRLLPEWMPDADRQSQTIVGQAGEVFGVDRDFQSLAQHDTIQRKVCGELHQLPFQDKSFDLVTANMVVEHLETPDTALREIARILKPGGLFLFHTPNAVGYSSLVTRLFPGRVLPHLSRFLLGRKVEDVYPTFYRLNTRAAISTAAAGHGLAILDYLPLESSAQSVILGPGVIPELLLIKLLRLRALADMRTNILAVLQKPALS